MGSFTLGRVFGIDVKVHVTFLIILVMAAMGGGSVGGAAFGVLSTVLLFACVVLHELGHSVVAQAYGIPVKQIILLPIGGLAQMTKRPKTPGQELWIALAGPAVNVVIALALALGGWLVLGSGAAAGFGVALKGGPSLTNLWAVLLLSNVGLAVFNLVPALPMDGGRVLRAILSWVTGPQRATRIAARVAKVVAVAMLGLALVTGQFMLGLIAVFVFFGAGAEVREEVLHGALAHVRAGDAVNPRALAFTPDTPLGTALQALTVSPQHAFAVLHFGRLVGVVTRRALLEAVKSHGPYGYVAGVMERKLPIVAPGVELSAARDQMNAMASSFVAVMNGDEFVGLVTELELAQQAAVADAVQGFGRRGPRAWARE
jgi:Zn-dependent protease/CBS domain-containing protein